MIEKTPMAEGRSASEIDAQAAQTMEELRISHSSLCYEMQRKLVAVKREQLAQMAQQVEAEARWEELTERKDRLERYGQYQAGLARQLERAEVHYFKLRALLQRQSRS